MQKRSRAAAFAAAAAAGAAAGFAHRPGPGGALMWVAYVPLLWALDAAAPGEAFLLGSAFGLAAHVTGIPWILALTRGFLRASLLPAALVAAAACALFGLRWAAAAAVAACARGPAARAACFAAACVALEAYWPALFPSEIAYTQLFHLPTVQCAAVLGSAAVAALVLAANACVWLCFANPGPRSLSAAALVASLALGNEAWGRRELARVESAAAARPSIAAAVVQAGTPNAPWSGAAAIDESPRYERLTAEAARRQPLDLAVWPENSYRGRLRYGAGAALPRLLEARGASPAVLLNTVGVGDDGLSRNVSLLAEPGGRLLGFAEKRLLMPFGEYLPRGLGWLDRVIPSRERLWAGRAPGLLALGRATRLGVAICFEDVPPGPQAELAGLGAQILVAQTNDSWFSPPQPEQHLLWSVLRAVENRRAVLHAARTGVSAIVRPSGRVEKRLELGEQGALIARVPLMDERATGARVGAWLSRAALVLAAGLAFSGAAARGTAPA